MGRLQNEIGLIYSEKSVYKRILPKVFDYSLLLLFPRHTFASSNNNGR